MSDIGTIFPTLTDLAKRTDPDGAIAKVVEVLQKKNPLLDDIAFKEGNLLTGHVFTSRTALPTPTWRRYNEGVDAQKSESEQVEETCGMLEDFSKVDVKLANLGGNAPAFRASEDVAFIQAYAIEVERAFFYENLATNPSRIHGLTPRFDGPVATHPAGAQIIKSDASASGNTQASIWLVGWSPDTVYGIYPKGSKVGLQHKDLGERLTTMANGKEGLCYVTQWGWDLGLAVHDSRYVVRGANIDVDNLAIDATTGVDLLDLMNEMYEAIHETRSVQPVWYMNRTISGMLRRQLAYKGQTNALEWVLRGGHRVQHYLDAPIRVTDTLTNTESIVS